MGEAFATGRGELCPAAWYLELRLGTIRGTEKPCVPGALLDRSWRAGRPGMVGESCGASCTVVMGWWVRSVTLGLRLFDGEALFLCRGDALKNRPTGDDGRAMVEEPFEPPEAESRCGNDACLGFSMGGCSDGHS